MRIEEEVKLDYGDVLIRPKRSTLKSRNEVSLERKLNFRNYEPRFEDAIEEWHYRGIPIVAANMDGVATFEMADTLAKQGLFTCLVKTYSVDELVGYFNLEPSGLYRTDYVAMSVGTSSSDYDKLASVFERVQDRLKYLCIDVANGYSEYFVEHVRKVRNAFPNLVIIAGNVVTADQTQELILNGADIVKVGIGPGSVCFFGGTKVKTIEGYKNIEDIKIGDEVLTHKNRYKKVISTFKNKTTSLIEVNGVKCTPSHRFYVVNKSDASVVNSDNYQQYAYWIEAHKIGSEHLIVKL